MNHYIILYINIYKKIILLDILIYLIIYIKNWYEKNNIYYNLIIPILIFIIIITFSKINCRTITIYTFIRLFLSK